MGSSSLYVLDFILKPVAGVELPKEVFTSRARWMSLIVKWNTSANMFYLLKNLLLLILVIFKLKCNTLIFNEFMVLNASYVCLHAFSLRRESADLDPGWRTPHFWGGSVTKWGSPGWRPSRASLGVKTSSREQRPDFNLVETLRTVVVCETPRATRMMCRSGSSPVGCISIWVTVTLSNMSDRLSVAVIS
jgi:hypothetical protein